MRQKTEKTACANTLGTAEEMKDADQGGTKNWQCEE